MKIIFGPESIPQSNPSSLVVGITDEVGEIREIGGRDFRLFEIGAHIGFLDAEIGIDVGEEIALDTFVHHPMLLLPSDWLQQEHGC